MNVQEQAVTALRVAADAIDKALVALGAAGVSLVSTILTAVLGPRGEYRLPGLASLNAAYLERFPTGWTDQYGDPGDAATSPTRIPLHLIGAVIDPRVLIRQDLSDEVRAFVHQACNVDAYGTYLGMLHQDEVTRLQRFSPIWLDSTPPPGPGASQTAILAPGFYATDEQVLAAIRRWYEITYGPLN